MDREVTRDIARHFWKRQIGEKSLAKTLLTGDLRMDALSTRYEALCKPLHMDRRKSPSVAGFSRDITTQRGY